MSYILDALKKSEEARQRGQAPDAGMLVTALEGSERQTPVLPWVVATVAVAVAAGLAGWLWLETPPDGSAIDAPAAMASPASAREPLPPASPAGTADDVTPTAGADPRTAGAAASSQDTATGAMPAAIAAGAAGSAYDGAPSGAARSEPDSAPAGRSDTEAARPVTAAPIEATTARAIPVTELSTAEQERIPPLQFSTHIYAEDRDLREVGINGRTYREGERIDGELELVEITEPGVIVRSGDLLVEIGVLEDWRH